MIKWSEEVQVIDTPYGRMTRPLAAVMAEHEAKRQERRREFGEILRAGETLECSKCGEEIPEGATLVHFPYQDKFACAKCAGLVGDR